MALHHKPTKEELQASIEAADAALAALTPEDNIDPLDGDPAPSEPAPSEPEPTPSKPVPDESEPTPSKPVPPADQDWKKRYTDSSREAKVLSFKNKEINDAVDNAAQLPEPTDEELLKEFPEWEEMTGVEQRLAKSDLLNKKRFELVHQATQKFKAVEEWNGQVDTFVEDPKTLIANPELEGKTEEFKQFASKPSRRGVDFEDLILAFLGDEAKKVKPNHQGQKMFESGTGGSKESSKPKDDSLSTVEGRNLMKTDYKKFIELLRAGKIRND